MVDILEDGSQRTDLSAQAQMLTPVKGLASAVMATARNVIQSVTPTTWFGPWQPLPPMAPPGSDRKWDYPTGMNLNYTPRSNESVSFEDMRTLADACEILRIIIEARKTQMSAMDWVIRPRLRTSTGMGRLYWDPKKDPEDDNVVTGDQRTRIQAITEFLRYPDKEQDWDQWQGSMLEEMLVTDATAVQRRYTRGKKLYALEQMDGATIKPLITGSGRRPVSPDPAYQQVIKGIVAADFTDQELFYLPRNVRVNKIYGYSPVEQVIMTANTQIRRGISQLQYYTEGTQPDAFIGLPKEWNLDNIKGFQAYFDALMSGMLGKRRKIRFMPGEFKYQETKPPPLKDIYDEWLARLLCFAIGVPPTPFIQQMARSAGKDNESQALESSKAPTSRWLKSFLDRIIREDFDSSDLEFLHISNVEQDPKTQMEIDVGYVKAGIDAIDEVRTERGRVAVGGVAAQPMLATNTGYVALDNMTIDNQVLLANNETINPTAPGAKNAKTSAAGLDSTNPNSPTATTSPAPKSEPTP
jgi:hypothetical protein